SHGIDSGDDVVAQVGRFETLRLQGGDESFDLDIDLHQTRCKSLALAQCDRQRALAEAVPLLEERAVRSPRKTGRLLVNDAERQQLGCLELSAELGLPRLTLPLRE